MSKFHLCSDQLPEKAGYYRTRRRMPNGIVEEDISEFAFSSYDGKPHWANARGVVIKSVIEWREEADK